MEKSRRANKLNELMRQRGLTGAALARVADVDRNEISRLRRGKRWLTELWAQRLAPHLGVTWPELLGWETDGSVTLTDDEKCLVFAYRALPAPEAKAHLELLRVRQKAQSDQLMGEE